MANANMRDDSITFVYSMEQAWRSHGSPLTVPTSQSHGQEMSMCLKSMSLLSVDHTFTAGNRAAMEIAMITGTNGSFLVPFSNFS